MKKDFSASVLKKIHAKKIAPRERYYFIAMTMIRVFAGIAFLAFGMLSVALVWHLIHNFAFLEFILERPNILGKIFWFGVPVFWMILSVTLWVVTEQVVQRTDRAYRIPFWAIGVALLFLQVIGGFILEQSRVGERIDVLFETRMDWYHGAERMNQRMERMPEQGFLVGEIMEVKSDTFILLNDITRTQWEVHFEQAKQHQPEFKEGMEIRMIGEMTGIHSFHAVSWKPARGRPMDRRSEELLKRKDGRNVRPPRIDRLRPLQERN